MKELLVPCGNMENLKVAIHAGADAVYLGGKKFGARAFAHNFDNEEMIEAIKLCHLYGVKIYVTVNTMTFESEFDEVCEYLTFLHKNGVDAVIVQDLGLIKWIHEALPNLEVHASTQVHTTNSKTIKLLEKLGVKRVVVARELSLEEIANLDTDLEIEAFIHGALCISYSGECLFSAMLMDRSGNRGSCAQVCRLPYSLMCNDKVVNTDGNYLLSTKELNTAKYFKGIMESNITSLKIEGRMKSAEYVACVTKLYRDLIDKYNRGEECIPNQELLNDLAVIFNRDYTKGFINNATNQELMNIKTSNHVGVPIGEVIRTTNKYIYIRLTKELNQGDGIRFNEVNEGLICNYIYNMKEELINSGKVNDVVLVDNKFKLHGMFTVNKTLDVKVIEKYTNIEEKKLGINISFIAKVNSPMKIIINYNDITIEKTGNVVNEAINQPLTSERIQEQLTKLGGTPFIVNDISMDIDDNIFMPIKDINELRRNAIDELIDKLMNNKKEVIINDYHFNDKLKQDKGFKINVLVRNEEQLLLCLKHNVTRIIVENKNLFLKYKYKDNVYYRSSRIGENNNLEHVVGTELGAIYDKCEVADYYLNIANHGVIDVLSDYAKVFTLSVELDDSEIANIMNYYHKKVNAEVIVYSTVELMITKYCPLNLLVNKDKSCTVCMNGNKYYLKDRNDEKYRLLHDPSHHITHIMHHKPLVKIDHIDYYKSLGIKDYRIEFLDEKIDKCEDILNQVESVLNK